MKKLGTEIHALERKIAVVGPYHKWRTEFNHSSKEEVIKEYKNTLKSKLQFGHDDAKQEALEDILVKRHRIDPNVLIRRFDSEKDKAEKDKAEKPSHTGTYPEWLSQMSNTHRQQYFKAHPNSKWGSQVKKN